MIERAIQFERPRRMRCGSCHHEWRVTAEWLDNFSQAFEACPNCGTDCPQDDRPNFCAEPLDPSHDDSAVRQIYWYHSSTHGNWPDKNFNPAAQLTDATKQRMEAMGAGSGPVERWAQRQKSKALHLGTYEAAIENMFRRMNNQGSSAAQFFLYRVQLSPSCVVEPGVYQEPTNFVGDAHLAEACAPGVNVLRYVNVHEDQSSISLAVDLNAILAVQKISIPVGADESDPQVINATARLLAAGAQSPTRLEPWMHRAHSALMSEARKLEDEVAAALPLNLRERFNVQLDETGFEANPTAFPRKLVGLAQLVTDSQAVLESLNAEEWVDV